jgi:hypothetical protein
MVQFEQARTQLSEQIDSTFQGLDEQLEDRRRTLNELNDKIAYEERQGQIKIKQNLDEFGLTEARNVLGKLNRVDILRTELHDLRSELAKAQASRVEEIEKAVQDAVQREKIIHKSQLGRIDAEAKLKLAETQAQLTSKDVIIENLQVSLKKQEAALDAQRSLTKDVADAASRSTTSVYAGSNSK